MSAPQIPTSPQAAAILLAVPEVGAHPVHATEVVRLEGGSRHLPMYGFTCSCGHQDMSRRSPFGLAMAMAEHEQS